MDFADPREPPKSKNPPNTPHIPPAEHRPENPNPSQETWKELTIWKKFERVFKVLEAVGIASGFVVLLVLVGQYEEMKTSRMEDERAWVFTRGIARESFSGVQQESNSATFKIEIKNSGKTPALNFRSVIGYDNQTNDIGKIDTLDTNDFMVLPPDASVYEFLPVSVKKGDSLWVVGINRYDDIFGKQHWSTFCWKVEGDRFDIFAGTPFHNRATMREQNKQIKSHYENELGTAAHGSRSWHNSFSVVRPSSNKSQRRRNDSIRCNECLHNEHFR